MNRIRTVVVLVIALGLLVVSAPAMAGTATHQETSRVAQADADTVVAKKKKKKLVRKLRTQAFGKVLATPKRQALYYWTPEKRNPGKILCTGACARAWPPLIVKKWQKVTRKIRGFKGTFGTIKRPDGRLQLTYNRLPLYTYAHEGPGQVLCDDVNGWFVARV